jgi:colanic acid biosynthesis glycosyl transferase WcaI
VFLIVGQGTGKARLLDRVQRDGLRNVLFAPLQAYDDLPALLASADAHLVIQKRGVADAVLPSKLTNILAVGGNAIITADPDTTLGRLCEEHRHCGVDRTGVRRRVERGDRTGTGITRTK